MVSDGDLITGKTLVSASYSLVSCQINVLNTYSGAQDEGQLFKLIVLQMRHKINHML